VNFLTQFSFNSPGQPILSDLFALVAIHQVNFLTQSFLNSGPETTVAVFDLAELFGYFEEFWIKIVSDVLLFERMLFQWPFQCVEAILRGKSYHHSEFFWSELQSVI
jgi:hypothetical protein